MYNSYLRGLIKNSGLTQKQFSSLTGIHHSVISHIITGRRTSVKHKATIAEFFGKPESTIFDVKSGVYKVKSKTKPVKKRRR